MKQNSQGAFYRDGGNCDFKWAQGSLRRWGAVNHSRDADADREPHWSDNEWDKWTVIERPPSGLSHTIATSQGQQTNI